MSLWNIVSFWLLTLLVIITCMSVCICRSGFLSLDDAVMLKEWIQGSSWCFVDGLSFACLLWLLHSCMCLVWQSHALKLSKCEDLKQDVLRETLQLWALFYSFFFFFFSFNRIPNPKCEKTFMHVVAVCATFQIECFYKSAFQSFMLEICVTSFMIRFHYFTIWE